MDDYNKIIESLNIKFIRSNTLNVIQPVKVSNFYDVQNTLILVNSGVIKLDEDEEARPGDLIFLPGGKSAEITFGGQETDEIPNDVFMTKRDQFLRQHGSKSGGVDTYDEVIHTNFTTLTFDVKAFDSVNFFTSLDLPPFVVKQNKMLKELTSQVYREHTSDMPGKSRITNIVTEHLIIELFRYILLNNMFVEQLATNSNYFKDSRLIDIFNYIKEHLAGDLSNKVLAGVANVSEDYVGQYFKMLTGINPQDYIEYQRMEKAVELLRTSKKSIRAIGQEVGYKDTAYFCRRFKMMFGIPAGKMRRRDSLIDI
ncbi:AraC family transcriptional regulator [Limibacter armeniacum]|uniref:helix-turn-helix domain-containing protein n=1 Tax=Limibacter armeniacum TaxID=466084 RepID=UPI002FE509D6